MTAPTLRELPLRVLPLPLLRARRSALGGRGSAHLIERHARVYRRTWLVLVSGIFEPLFYLLSVGVGIGHLVGTVAGPGGPVGYTSFVAPALLATSAMNGAIYDSTFNVFFRLKYAKFYDAALATPMRPGDLALGEIGWALIRGGLYGCAFMVVMLALGLVHSPWAVADLPVALLIGFGSAAAGMAATTFMRSWQDFDVMGTIQFALFLFSGTFAPVGSYPAGLRALIEATPLYHGVELIRGITTGSEQPAAALVHAGYLLAMTALGLLVAGRRMGRLLLK